MEDSVTAISAHQPVSAVKSVSGGPKVYSVAPQDTVSISNEALEAQKKTSWVDMLKEMPEVRDIADHAHLASHVTPKIIETITERLLEI